MDAFTTTVDEAFAYYRLGYPARAPILKKKNPGDELALIDEQAGLLSLGIAPMENITLGEPPRAFGESDATKYLWVVLSDNCPIALEHGENRKTLARKYLSHTNLTGGAEAHCGGELWFHDTTAIVFNGGSGRYPPRGIEEIEAVGDALRDCGYKVGHMGWNEDISGSERFLRGEPIWM